MVQVRFLLAWYNTGMIRNNTIKHDRRAVVQTIGYAVIGICLLVCVIVFLIFLFAGDGLHEDKLPAQKPACTKGVYTQPQTVYNQCRV
jgi:hypothetical protein